MGCLYSLIAVLIAAKMLSAQSTPIFTQENELARQLLNSSRWVDKAWGAYLAAHFHSNDLDNQLIAQIRSAGALRDAQSDSEAHAFLAVLFDAVIEAGITIPATLLEPFEESWTDPVVILLARDKDSAELLLQLSGEKSPDRIWLAANNLLFERRSQSWYRATLGEITITHRFTVTDPGASLGVGGGERSGFCGDGVAGMPKGFPPVTLYTLQHTAERGSVLLVKGPQDVYYTRTMVPTNKQVAFGSCDTALDRAAVRLGYLAQLRHESLKETERLFRSETQIQYTNIKDFERQVEESMKAQELGIRAFLHAIEEGGLNAGDARLQIMPEVNDKRHAATESLPIMVPREIELH